MLDKRKKEVEEETCRKHGSKILVVGRSSTEKKKWRELCEAQGQYGENLEPITEGWTEA